MGQLAQLLGGSQTPALGGSMAYAGNVPQALPGTPDLSQAVPQGTNALAAFTAPQSVQPSFGGDMSATAGVPASIPQDQSQAPQNFMGHLANLFNFHQDPQQLAADPNIGARVNHFFDPNGDPNAHPISGMIGHLGDILSSVAAGKRSTPYEDQLVTERAKGAINTLFADPTNNAAWATLTQADPKTALDLRKQLLSPAAAVKPVDVAPGHYLTLPDGKGGYKTVYQAPAAPGSQAAPYVFTSSNGGLFRGNKQTGESQFIPSPVPLDTTDKDVTTMSTPQGALMVNKRTKETYLVPGTAPTPKTPKTADTASGQAALDALDNIQSGFDHLKSLKALPGEGGSVVGQAMGAFGRSGIGQLMGEQVADPAAQTRLMLHKNLSLLQQQLIKDLPASATRSRFEQEILKTTLPDPSKMDYATATQVIGQLRSTFKKGMEAARSSPASSQNNIPTLSDPSQVAKLPKGSQFYSPDGVLRQVP